MLKTRIFFTKPWSNDLTLENPELKITVKVKHPVAKVRLKMQKLLLIESVENIHRKKYLAKIHYSNIKFLTGKNKII